MKQTAEDKRSDRERFYDEVIAPALHSVVQQCEAAGMSIIALVEFEPEHFERQGSEQPDACISFQLARLAAEVNGDFDRFVACVMRHAETHGHSSSILRQLGVPRHPHDRSVH